jgi:hypothetical protein
VKKDILLIGSTLILTIVLAGCGATPLTPNTLAATRTKEAAPPTASTTPDPCSSALIEPVVQKVHSHMREFDDAAILASNTPREQLSTSIANLQRIRREAEDEPIPGCLTDMKKYQVQHMNSVINTLVAFMGAADQQSLDEGISLAREQHDQYTLELARVLGLTVVPADTPGATLEIPTP